MHRSFSNCVWHQKISHYVYGQKFMLLTDHKPLITILSPKASIISEYHYDIEFCPTTKYVNADGLTRLPLESIATAGIGDSAISRAFIFGDIT